MQNPLTLNRFFPGSLTSAQLFCFGGCAGADAERLVNCPQPFRAQYANRTAKKTGGSFGSAGEAEVVFTVVLGVACLLYCKSINN